MLSPAEARHPSPHFPERISSIRFSFRRSALPPNFTWWVSIRISLGFKISIKGNLNTKANQENTDNWNENTHPRIIIWDYTVGSFSFLSFFSFCIYV